METVKISWSGGKDSTCATLLLLPEHKCKIVCYIPMFNENTPLILKEHYEFIMNMKERFEHLGGIVHIVTGISYYDFFYTRSSRGEYKGRMFCWPPFITGICNFKRSSKLKSLKDCYVGFYDYEDIGIAYDEKQRYHNLSKYKRSVLVERKITESYARLYCMKYNALSPIYKDNKKGRDGCALCPQAKEQERQKWFSENPHVIPIIREMQEVSKIERPEQTPLRNYQWFVNSG